MGARGRRKERRARARRTGTTGRGRRGGAQAGARDLSFHGRLPHHGGKSRRRTDAAASRGPAPERSAPGRGSGGGEGHETGPRGRGTAPPNDPRGSLSLSARTGRARGGGGRAGPAGGGPASHPTGGAANDPGDAASPPLAPRHPTGPRRRVPTAGESGRGRERERRSARGRSREEGRPAARRRRAGRTRPARTHGARANAGHRPRLNFGRRRAPGSGALRADSQPRDATPPRRRNRKGGRRLIVKRRSDRRSPGRNPGPQVRSKCR